MIEALADHNQAIQLDPNDAMAYNNRGNVYNDQGKYDLALADLNQAIQLDPNDAIAYTNRGALYISKMSSGINMVKQIELLQEMDADCAARKNLDYLAMGI